MTQATSTTSDAPFLGDLSILTLKTEYRSLKENPAHDFYRPCLLNSILYRRAVGYFRSTVYNVIGSSILEFTRRGGRTQLICSPHLSEEDISSIALGYARKSKIIEERLISEIDALLTSEESSLNTRTLATLISVGALEIKIAVRADKKGLYHEKIGVFSDGVRNLVSFKGSANETWNALHTHGNFESIEVFCSWRGGLEAERVQKHVAHFDSLWEERDTDIEVFAFPTTAIAHLRKSAFKDLAEADGAKEILPAKRRRATMPHQDAAVSAWLACGARGILEHATGSGKTFTALTAIKHHIEQGFPALIVVPSRLLLQQWAGEIREELPSIALLMAGGGHGAWKEPQRLSSMTNPISMAEGRVVLATMQTASSERFRKNVSPGTNLLLVADEVHQIGSPQHAKIMSINAGKRLGLSATPVRYGDPDGSSQLFGYFGGVVPPPITLNDAIKSGRLVNYEYYPHTVNLTAIEAEQWQQETDNISREVAKAKKDKDGRSVLSEKARLLLIKRSRIAKKASAKIRLARSVLRDSFAKGQSWLVYCEDADQLSDVITAIRAEDLNPIEYHSKMAGDRDATMSWFRRFGGILVSIRCLDEGVDIPDVSHALILASSQNPRQFIQRRGRVLRRTDEKNLAVIHDAIVVPVNAVNEPEQVSLLKSELVRAIEFADNAINRSANAELRNIAIEMGLDPATLAPCGIEEDEEIEEDAE